jgi:hypothetical protein
MLRRVRVAMIGMLVVSAAYAGETTGCAIRKGLYDAWLSLAKRTPNTVPKAALFGASRTTSGGSTQDIYGEYRTFFQCLSDTAVPAGEDGVRSMCKEAAADRIGLMVCQVALYVKTNRTAGTELLDALPASKKGAEIVWDLDAIATTGAGEQRFPTLFAPRGPAFRIIDEVFMLALDDRETAMAKYFHMVGSATGAGLQYTDAQVKILLRESPALVVKHWAVLRQHQPTLKRLLAEFSKELPGSEMNKIRQGVAGFCTKDNLDCPEIQKVVGRPE